MENYWAAGGRCKNLLRDRVGVEQASASWSLAPVMRGFLVLSDENSKYKRAHGPIWLKLQMHECFLTPESWSLVHRERISSVESGKVPVSCHRNHGLFKPDFLDYQMRIMISISPRVFLKSNIGTSWWSSGWDCTSTAGGAGLIGKLRSHMQHSKKKKKKVK